MRPDVDKVVVSQRAYVTADAFGATKFWDRVVRVAEVLGKENVYTDERQTRLPQEIFHR